MVFLLSKFSINNLLTESSVMNNLLSPTNSMRGAETIRFLFRSKPKAYKITTAISISINRMLFQFNCFIVFYLISYFGFTEIRKERSEERRVGKECRSRRWRDDEKKK